MFVGVLVSSSDPTANYTEYDSHGNATYIGTGTSPLRLCYDSSDRNSCLVSYDASGNGSAAYYNRDVTGRTTYREHDSISAWNWNMDMQQWYGFSGSGDAPDWVYDASWTITEKYLQLPGGVLLAIRPQQSGASQKQYTLPGVLGRTLLTTDAAGTNTSAGNGPLNSFTYDPYGNILPGSTNPANATNGSYGYGASLQKLTETLISLSPIQMGARVYLPTIGRFTSPDPIDGGNANAYVYVVDPINANDYTGMFGLGDIWHAVQSAGSAVVSGAKTAYRVVTPYVHYLTGRGTPIATETKSYSWDVKSIAQQAVGKMSHTSQSFQTSVQSQPKDLAGKAIVGTGTVFVGGDLTVNGNHWSLKGTISGGYDYYDFNRTWGKPGKPRDPIPELSVWAGALGGGLANAADPVLFQPTNYYDILVGEGITFYASGTYN